MEFESFVFGSLLTMGICHLGLFSFHRKDSATLYLGLACILFAARALAAGGIASPDHFPGNIQEASIRFEYLAIILGLLAPVMYFHALFPGRIHKRALPAAVAAGAVFALAALAAPAGILAGAFTWCLLFTAIMAAYLALSLLPAVAEKKEGAAWALGGGVIFALVSINDILYYTGLVHTGSFSLPGLVVFTLSQSLFQARRLSGTLSNVERRSENLDGQILEIKEINRDLEKRVALIEKSRHRFLSNIAHDLRTPMTTIQGYIEAILDGVIDEPDLNRYLRLIHNKVLGINSMTRDLFELTRLESRQVEMKFTPVPAERLVGRVYERYRLDVQASGITFGLRMPSPAPEAGPFPESSCPPDAHHFSGPVVEVDADRIDRVFANLIFNAIRYTPQGGTITMGFSPGTATGTAGPAAEGLDAYRAGVVGEVVFCVQDTGTGISGEDLPHVFDRFYKVSKSRGSALGSSGLGLAIAKEIIEIHGGRIWAESTPGTGSAFYFTLPESGRPCP